METTTTVGKRRNSPGAKAYEPLGGSAAPINHPSDEDLSPGNPENPCPFKTEDSPTTSAKTAVDHFLREYARRTDEGDVAELVTCFAETFMAGGPQGAKALRAGDFGVALPKRYQRFEQMGCRRTELIGVEEQWLDARYVAARTRWRLTFERAGKEPLPIEVESTYLVDAGAEPLRILVYLAHDDIMEKLKQQGIARA